MFGCIREPFRARFRFYVGDERPTFIQWGFAKPGAAIYFGQTPIHPFRHPFSYDPLEAGAVGELDSPRRSFKGPFGPFLGDGIAPDGTEEELTGHAAVPLGLRADGTLPPELLPACAHPPGIAFGADSGGGASGLAYSAFLGTPTAGPLSAGLSFGAKSWLPADEQMRTGIAFLSGFFPEVFSGWGFSDVSIIIQESPGGPLITAVDVFVLPTGSAISSPTAGVVKIDLVGLGGGGTGADLTLSGPGVLTQAVTGGPFVTVSTLPVSKGGTGTDLTPSGPGVVTQAVTGGPLVTVSTLSVSKGGTGTDLTPSGPGVVTQAVTGGSLVTVSTLPVSMGGTGADLSLAGPGLLAQTASGSIVSVVSPGSNGDVLTVVGGVWASAAPTSGPPSGSAGGDLGGSYPNPTVAGLLGYSLAGVSSAIGNLIIGAGPGWNTINAFGGDLANIMGSLALISTGPGAGTYTVGSRLNPGGTDGTITLDSQGRVTAVTQAT